MRVNYKVEIEKLKKKAKKLKEDIYLIYLAYKHPKTPWQAKGLVIITIAYAMSPVDLIPDFIPIIGYLDDLLILPLLIALSIKLIPKEVIKECREEIYVNGDKGKQDMKKAGRIGGFFIVLVWILVILLIISKIKF